MNISESLIREIVEKVIRETVDGQSAPFEKHVDPSGIIGIKTSTVELEPFEGRSDVRAEGRHNAGGSAAHGLRYHGAARWCKLRMDTDL